MARQRWREPDHHRGGWRHGRRVVPGLLLLIAACGGQRSLYAPDDDQIGTGGTGSDARLVGNWQTVLLIDVTSDLQTWTTTWSFRDDLTCRFSRSILSIVEGVPRVTLRPCTWRTANAIIQVTYTDIQAGTSQLPYQFISFDPNRLQLEGLEYRRVTTP